MSNTNYAKLIALDRVHGMFEQARQLLHQEALAQASNHTRLQRRLRMLTDLATYQAQIYDKISRFKTHSAQDYAQALDHVGNEIQSIINRNG